MPHSARLSVASAACRLEWRPSRWLFAALSALGLLAGCSIIASELPRIVAWPTAVAVLACGLWMARREARKPPRWLVWPGNGAPVTLDGVPIDRVIVQWCGALAFASWQGADGRRRRLHWWPDTLPAARRRELRLAATPAAAVPATASMAP